MNPRILLVDDAPQMLRLLGRILGASLDAQVDVQASADGKAALAALAAHPFDLVITDLRMPGASGLDVLREAKRHRPGPEVLLLTGFASAEVLREASRLGAYRCVQKPFDPDELTLLIRGALDRAIMSRVHHAVTGPTTSRVDSLPGQRATAPLLLDPSMEVSHDGE